MTCQTCHKPDALCVCDKIEPIDTKIFVLILQHPQEQDRDLGTARLLHLQLRNSALKVGLSWPNLARALGRPAEPRRWGTLYLGSAGDASKRRPPLLAVDTKGQPLADQAGVLGALDGIILLDGSRAQAKALWWRNAWLLKTRRLIVDLGTPSLYGRLRQEPRTDSVSTIEAGAFCLAELEHGAGLGARLTQPFKALLERYRAARSGQPTRAP